MTGLFSLKLESRNQENDFEYLFMHLESVNRLKEKLIKYILPEDELNLIDYRLNNIPFTPSGYRFESFASRQDNMIYRTEGIIGTIWEKIKAFFRWILDKIKGLFGLNKESPTPPSTQEFQKVEKEASSKIKNVEEIIDPELDNKLEKVSKLSEEIKTGKNSDELQELMDRSALELSKATGISVETFKLSRSKQQAKNEKESTKKDLTPQELEAQKKKELEKEADKLVATLASLKSYNKKLFTKAKNLTEKMEKLFPSLVDDADFSILNSINGFFMVGPKILDQIVNIGTTKFVFGEANISIKDIKTDKRFQIYCDDLINNTAFEEVFYDFLGSTINAYEIFPEKYRLTKSVNNIQSHKNKDIRNYNKIINFVKNSHGSLILGATEKKNEVLKKLIEVAEASIKKIENEVNKLSKEDQQNSKSEALVFIQKLCVNTVSSYEQKLQYNNSVIAFINELHEFEKLVLKVDNFVQRPWESNQFNSESL